MSPLLYPILFDQIKLIVEKFFDTSGQVIVNETNTQFIDHIIFIMKNVLESKPENQPPENLGQTSIETMMLTIVRYEKRFFSRESDRYRENGRSIRRDY
jgi:neurofibromin 1